MTTKQAASRLGVTHGTVTKYIRHGVADPRHPGLRVCLRASATFRGWWAIDPVDLRAFRVAVRAMRAGRAV